MNEGNSNLSIDRKSLSILEVLIDKAPCTYYKVGKVLDIDSNKAKYALDKLIEAGAVSKVNVKELKKDYEEDGEGFFERRADELEIPPPMVQSIVEKDFNGKYLYAIRDTNVIIYQGMIIQYIDGQPIVYNCRYWEKCPHHNCGEEECLLIENGGEFIKKLLQRDM